MKSIWSYITYVTSFLTFSPVTQDAPQEPIFGDSNVAVPSQVATAIDAVKLAPSPGDDLGDDWPVFPAPGWEGHDFRCEYPKLVDYTPCSTPKDRSCWLKHRGDDRKLDFDIHTDYENRWPEGRTRSYTLVVEDGKINADGLWANDRQLINGTYPGPWLHACWGDTLRVKVINKLKYNGTAIHFHGARQHNTMHMDGVPGVTQCPIAPNDYFVYEFTVKQYGSSWYHSHYSVQYANGMLGPVTFHGPSSATWDEAEKPLLMTDWFHNSAFSVIHRKEIGYPTALLNGRGDITKHEYEVPVLSQEDTEEPEDEDTNAEQEKKPKTRKGKITPNAPIPAKHVLAFQRPEFKDGRVKRRRYLLRLINTSFSTNFVFSIDHHKIEIVGADFVPVNPSGRRTHVTIGIGQRYTVVVEADPVEYSLSTGYKLSEQNSFWIRTSVAVCLNSPTIGIDDYDRTGIVRYTTDDILDPITIPWSNAQRAQKECRDEGGLHPTLKWKIGPPSNGKTDSYGEEFTVKTNRSRATEKFPVGVWVIERYSPPDEDQPIQDWNPLQIDYSDPFFLQLDKPEDHPWPGEWVVIPEHDFDDEQWVYLAITGFKSRSGKETEVVAHPMHLHGHDFAVLEHEYEGEFPYNETNKFSFDSRRNPLRRDVVLLPNKGYVIVAFKPDNPGSWLLHCHIAFHASEGLALQINERQQEARHRLWDEKDDGSVSFAKSEAERVCFRWDAFESDCTRHWPGRDEERKCWPACDAEIDYERDFACHEQPYKKPDPFKDDSGV